MDPKQEAMIPDHLKSILFFGLIGALALYCAYRCAFFQVPSKRGSSQLPSKDSKVTIRFPLIGLSVYVSIFLFVPSFALLFLKQHFDAPMMLMTLSQIVSISSLFCFLFFFSSIQPHKTNQRIWNGSLKRGASLFICNVAWGIGSWFVCFPVVVFVSQVSEMLCYKLFGVSKIEQVATSYLKGVLSSLPLYLVALFFLLIAAPLIEELVFRGFMQTYFKQKWGAKRAVILSSLCFALFHLAPSQGASNLSLFFSLFILALFLGFLYERQKTLIAPIALHMTFNSISVIRIVLENT